MRRVCAGILLATLAVLLAAEHVAPYGYATQFREAPGAAPSRQHPLGTDALGRDRLSRLIYGARCSVLFAPAAALLSVVLALAAGLAAGCLGGWWERGIAGAADLCLSLPWLFLLFAVRALLPLDFGPLPTAAVTFALMGTLGWAGPARVIAAAARRHGRSDFALLARASGIPRARLTLVQIVPNLLPIVAAQFLIAVPAFLLAEANLGLLGLGIPEPLPSWGGLLRELENPAAVSANPWMLAPAAALAALIGCFHVSVRAEEAEE